MYFRKTSSVNGVKRGVEKTTKNFKKLTAEETV